MVYVMMRSMSVWLLKLVPGRSTDLETVNFDSGHDGGGKRGDGMGVSCSKGVYIVVGMGRRVTVGDDEIGTDIIQGATTVNTSAFGRRM